MDPNTVWSIMTDTSRTLATRQHAARDLAAWLDRDGFCPDGVSLPLARIAIAAVQGNLVLGIDRDRSPH